MICFKKYGVLVRASSLFPGGFIPVVQGGMESSGGNLNRLSMTDFQYFCESPLFLPGPQFSVSHQISFSWWNSIFRLLHLWKKYKEFELSHSLKASCMEPRVTNLPLFVFNNYSDIYLFYLNMYIFSSVLLSGAFENNPFKTMHI